MEMRHPSRSRENLSIPIAAGAITAGAAALAAMAAYNVMQARNSEELHPPKGRFVWADGVRLHVIEEGTGSAVVFLHGNIVTGEDFVLSGLLGKAARRHRAIAIDRPGYGYSERPPDRTFTPAEQAHLIRRAFDALAIDRTILVGHSWGALVALAMAMKYPAVVQGLVLLSGYYYPTRRFDIAMASALATPVIGDLVRYTLSPPLTRAVLPAMFRRMFAPRPISRRFAAEFPRNLPARPSQLRAENDDGAVTAVATDVMRERYRDLRMPVAILAGIEDRIVTPGRQSCRLHDEIAGSTLELVPHVGHMIHHAVPERIARTIDVVEERAARGR